MEMQFSEVGGVTKAALGGSLDTFAVTHATQGETYFLAHIPPEQPAVIDLSNVVKITSYGVRMLIDTARALSHPNKLALYGAHDDVKNTLKWATVREVLVVVETEAEAVAAVA